MKVMIAGMVAADAHQGGAAGADLLLNISGTVREPALFEPVLVRVNLDLDLAFNQQRHAVDGTDMRFDGHDQDHDRPQRALPSRTFGSDAVLDGLLEAVSA